MTTEELINKSAQETKDRIKQTMQNNAVEAGVLNTVQSAATADNSQNAAGFTGAAAIEPTEVQDALLAENYNVGETPKMQRRTEKMQPAQPSIAAPASVDAKLAGMKRPEQPKPGQYQQAPEDEEPSLFERHRNARNERNNNNVYDWYTRTGGNLTKRDVAVITNRPFLSDEEYANYINAAKKRHDEYLASQQPNPDMSYRGSNMTNGQRAIIRGAAAGGDDQGEVARIINNFAGLEGANAIPETARLNDIVDHMTDLLASEDPNEVAQGKKIQQALGLAGVSRDANGAFDVKKDGKSFQEQLDERVSKEKAREELDQMWRDKRTDAKRLGTQIGDLSATIGDMIKARNGAVVTPRDYSAMYNSLDAQQQNNYNMYLARMQKIKDDAKAEAERKRAEEAARQAALEKEQRDRDWQMNMTLTNAGLQSERDARLHEYEMELARLKAKNDRTNLYLKLGAENAKAAEKGTKFIYEGKTYELSKTESPAIVNSAFGILQKYLAQNDPLVAIDPSRIDADKQQEVNIKVQSMLADGSIYKISPEDKERILALLSGKEFTDKYSSMDRNQLLTEAMSRGGVGVEQGDSDDRIRQRLRTQDDIDSKKVEIPSLVGVTTSGGGSKSSEEKEDKKEPISAFE